MKLQMYNLNMWSNMANKVHVYEITNVQPKYNDMWSNIANKVHVYDIIICVLKSLGSGYMNFQKYELYFTGEICLEKISVNGNGYTLVKV